MTTFYVQIWNNETESWDNFKEGYTCAREANKLVDTLMNRGFFARVQCDEEG